MQYEPEENDDGNAVQNCDRESSQSDAIAASLRRVYQNVAEEPLPDQLRDLLEQLKRTDAR